ncbi:hypothetical protein F4818DRAFT_27716 [Hypoxylon cercidicola]|nr:hypothetical protein F4818DRAFT_27716 [Hypoxylon cercidicola]
MARLNEPMVSTDSVETLRRKFLRQNRDIARVNSTQSLKIRSLENECVRLLSENLDLRGQVLRLQTELEDSKAQRIADHALEIKEKMEAQLAEWGAMLAGLGHEPMPRVRSPRSPKRAKRRSSIGRTSMSEWKRRDTMSSMKDLEAAATQEGRLPPIWENKACPRETLSREEILALRSIVDESTESPDLGPPPVSRFVDEDPVKIDLPTRPTSDKPESNCSSLQNTPSDLERKPEQLPPPKMDRKKETASVELTTNPKPQETKQSAPVKPQPTDQAVKANLKRKLREEDEKENAMVSKPPDQVIASAKDQPQKTATVKARPIKLPSNRKDARDKSAGSTTQRKPLSAKSSNECIKSPKKAATKPPIPDDVVKELKPKKDPAPVEIPVPQSPPPVSIASVEIEAETETETETLSAEPNLAVPDTPEPTPREDVRDTPPPTDISVRGETSRGRRARAAVSYAEPNLRDKMRRPTKQLLDAVAGEGKQIRRTSQSKRDELPSGPSSAVKSEEKPVSWKDLPPAQGASQHASDVMASPLAQKSSRASPSDDLPTSVVMDRRKRNSTMAIDQGLAAGDTEPPSSSGGPTKPNSRGANRRLEEIAAREVEVAKIFDDKSDVYEFPGSSPKNDAKHSAPGEAVKKSSSNSSKGVRRSRSRRQSSMVREDWDLDAEDQHAEKGSRHAGSTRRATMMASKESKPELENGGPDSSLEGDSLSSAEADGSARDKISMRRRSMML